MKTLPKPLSITDVAFIVGGEAMGDLAHTVTGVADLADATPSDAVFLENRKYTALAGTAPAGCLFLAPDLKDTPCAAKGKVIVDEPRAAFAKLVRMIDEHAKTKILPISRFGLMEMTRQRENESLTDALFDPCPHCRGTGKIKSPTSMTWT